LPSTSTPSTLKQTEASHAYELWHPRISPHESIRAAHRTTSLATNVEHFAFFDLQVPGTHKSNFRFPNGWRNMQQGIHPIVQRIGGDAGSCIIFTEVSANKLEGILDYFMLASHR
jgi:hypothetical protein